MSLVTTRVLDNMEMSDIKNTIECTCMCSLNSIIVIPFMLVRLFFCNVELKSNISMVNFLVVYGNMQFYSISLCQINKQIVKI